MQIDWMFVGIVAITTVGFIEWVKALVKQLPPKPGQKTLPDWVWAVAMPVVAIGLTVLFWYTPRWVAWAFGALALAQLGYQSLIKLVQKKIEDLG